MEKHHEDLESLRKEGEQAIESFPKEKGKEVEELMDTSEAERALPEGNDPPEAVWVEVQPIMDYDLEEGADVPIRDVTKLNIQSMNGERVTSTSDNQH